MADAGNIEARESSSSRDEDEVIRYSFYCCKKMLKIFA